MNIYYVISAFFILFGGVLIGTYCHKNTPFYLLSFFIAASLARPVTDSHLAWFVELVFIIVYATFKKSYARDNRWYLLFLAIAFLSLLYSTSLSKGILGIVMYCFPLFYYALAAKAIRSINDAEKLFQSISKSVWAILALGIMSRFDKDIVFAYYGMGICTIPVFLYFKTRKKIFILHFAICLLPALIIVKRTPFLGAAGAVMVFSILMYKWKAVIPSALAIILGLFLIVSIPSFRAKIFFDDEVSNTQILSKGNAGNVNMNGRLVFWGIVLEKYYAHAPVLGSGIGTVKAYLQSDQNEFKSAFSLMHNDWLLILCEQGLVGVLSLLLFMLGVLKRCIKYSANRYPKDLRLIAAACAGSVASTMIHMFFENCMNSFVFSTTFVFYAILNVCSREYTHNEIIE